MSSAQKKGDSGERISSAAASAGHSQRPFEGEDPAPAMTRRNHRREQIRAAALRLEQEGGECDTTSAGSEEGPIIGRTRTTTDMVADPSSLFLSIQLPVAARAALLIGGGAGNAPLGGGVPLSPMVTPPTVSQSAPRQGVAAAAAATGAGETNDTSSSKASPLSSPSSPGKKGGAASSSGGGTGTGVPHVYHDYGSVPDEPGYIRKKTGGVTQPFPEKLYEMLESEGQLQGDVVEWLPHGRAFIVRRPKDFTDRIMPKYVGVCVRSQGDEPPLCSLLSHVLSTVILVLP
jgi:HSF-type DNA-binding